MYESISSGLDMNSRARRRHAMNTDLTLSAQQATCCQVTMRIQGNDVTARRFWVKVTFCYGVVCKGGLFFTLKVDIYHMRYAY